MNKYEATKILKLMKARVPKACDTCGVSIEKGTEYFRESLGLLAKPPSFRLGSYCVTCGRANGRRPSKPLT